MDLGLSKLCARRAAFRAPVIHRLAGDVASPLGWWLATTSLWRTTALIAHSCTVRPNLSSAVGSEDKDKQADMEATWAFSSRLSSLVFGFCALKARLHRRRQAGKRRRPAVLRVTSLLPLRRRLRASSSPPRRRPY